MLVQITVNGKLLKEEVEADLTLFTFLRNHGCYSVKCGCETTNCGLCTVMMNGNPVLSCAVLAARADGAQIETLEGLQEEAAEFGAFIANQGADQCGFCNPGFIMNVIAMLREYENPSEEEMQEFLAGNLCRCSGYEGQTRALKAFLAQRAEKGSAGANAGSNTGAGAESSAGADAENSTAHASERQGKGEA